MIALMNRLNHYMAAQRYMKIAHHNHDMEDYIDKNRLFQKRKNQLNFPVQ